MKQGLASRVVAHHAMQHGGGAESGQVGRDVGGATRDGVLVHDGHDRDRRLGRDSFHIAHEVAVEHDIPDHQDHGFGDGVEERLEALATERMQGLSH